MGPSPSPAWIPFPTAVYRAAAPRRSRPPPIRAVPGALPPSLRPIRSLGKDPVHGSFECSPTPVPHDRLRLPPPSSFGLALHRRSPPSEPWMSLAALQASLRAGPAPACLPRRPACRRRRPDAASPPCLFPHRSPPPPVNPATGRRSASPHPGTASPCPSPPGQLPLIPAGRPRAAVAIHPRRCGPTPCATAKGGARPPLPVR